jgi:hypothetical protein
MPFYSSFRDSFVLCRHTGTNPVRRDWQAVICQRVKRQSGHGPQQRNNKHGMQASYVLVISEFRLAEFLCLVSNASHWEWECFCATANNPPRLCIAAESTCGAQRGTFPTCASGTALDLDYACTVGGPAAPTDCSSDVCCKTLNTCEYVVGSRSSSFFRAI